MTTGVDSESARAFLQGEPPGPDDADFEALRATWARTLPTHEVLARAVESTGSADLVMLALVDALMSRPENAEAQRLYEAHMARLEARDTPISVILDEAGLETDAFVVLFAPGWFYQSQPGNNADFRSIRAAFDTLGIPNRLIPSADNVSIEHNAAIIADAIRAEAQRGRRVYLVSASKSGPEAAIALGELLTADESAHVDVWLNIGGVLRGSPLADAAADSAFVAMLLAFAGIERDGLETLTTRHLRDRFDALHIPDHVLVVDDVPVPLSGDITRRGDDGYCELLSHGPNDGLTLTIDSISAQPNSIVLVEPGLDHFLASPTMPLRAVALLLTIEELLEGGRATARR